MRKIATSCLIVVALTASRNSFAQQTSGIGTYSRARGISGTMIAAVSSDGRQLSWANSNPVNWMTVRLPAAVDCFDVVGGSPSAILILTANARDETGDPLDPIYSLKSVGTNGTIADATSNVGFQCDFFDDRIGCQVRKRNVKDVEILTTSDGGQHWRAIPFPLSALTNTVSTLGWASRNELVVAKNEDKSVTLFEVDEKASKPRWQVKLGTSVVSLARCDKERVWARTRDDIELLNLADGKSVARFNPDISMIAGFSAHDNRVFVWGVTPHGGNVDDIIASSKSQTTLSIWDWDGKQFNAEQSLRTAPLAGVVPLDRIVVLAFANGQIGLLDGDRVIEQTISVTQLGASAATQPLGNKPVVAPFAAKSLPADWLPTTEQQMAEVTWGRQVSQQNMAKIIGELDPNLTPRQQCLFITEQCKRLVESQAK